MTDTPNRSLAIPDPSHETIPQGFALGVLDYTRRAADQETLTHDQRLMMGYVAFMAGRGDEKKELQAAQLFVEVRVGELLGPHPAPDSGPGSGKVIDDNLSKELRHQFRSLAWNPDDSPRVDQARRKIRDGVLSRSRLITELNADYWGTPTLPEGQYQVLYADPPWRYDFAESPDRREIENQYPTMELDEIKALDPPAASDSVLFMWATSPKLAESIEVLEAWGFDYRTCMVWVKDKIGMGYYARQRHELLLIAKRGEFPVPEPSTRPDSVIEAPRGKHSVKPKQVYHLLETMYPDASRIELFARNERQGWDSWGNEA